MSGQRTGRAGNVAREPNRAKSNKVGERQLALAKKFREAGSSSDATMATVQAAARTVETEKYETQECNQAKRIKAFDL